MSSRSTRQIDPSKTRTHLESRHRSLKEQITGIEAQRTLSIEQRSSLKRLKKEKLATKDALVALI